MEKFFVLYMIPMSQMEEWMQMSQGERKDAEEQMKKDWEEWVSKYEDHIVDEGGGLGKTMLVTQDGITPTKNDNVFYSIVEAETHEEAAQIFRDHPHLQIPQASIEIMSIMPMDDKK